MNENFKKYYKFPLEYDGITYVWTADGNMAIMFPLFFEKQPIIQLSKQDRIDIVNIINGKKVKTNIDFSKVRDNFCGIYIENKSLFTIRGWGHLTGRGGFNLHTNKAVDIQDDFINYIIDKLKNNEV